MQHHITTQQQFDQVFDTYGAMLFHFISQFTNDELKVRSILYDVLWDVPGILQYNTGPVRPVTRLLQQVRRRAIAYLEKDPSFDPWADWPREPDFFPLTHASLTPLHKRLFWWRYYRDRSEEAIARHTSLPLEEVRQLLCHTLQTVGIGLKKQEES